MSWQILYISNPAVLTLKNRQLKYQSLETDEVLTFPIEDVSVIVLEHKQVTLTHALLSACMEGKIVIFTCDEKHIPNGALFPFAAHSRYALHSKTQLSASEPFKKKLWQQIIKQKIFNQATVLSFYKKEGAKPLFEMAKQVKSGDPDNLEGYAARIYWDAVFKNFSRRDNTIHNAALDYGYAIMRGALARAIVGSGLLPAVGLHHDNQLNNYNLADDLIEPFRPFVDALVLQMRFEKDVLQPKEKQELVLLLTRTCLMNDEEITVLKAVEYVVQSLMKSFENKDVGYLKLPTFKFHKNVTKKG